MNWLAINDFLEPLFAETAASQSKSIIIGAVYPGPGVGGGSILWQRKKRFAKKRTKWLEEVKRLSLIQFLRGGGLRGMANKLEWVRNEAKVEVSRSGGRGGSDWMGRPDSV